MTIKTKMWVLLTCVFSFGSLFGFLKPASAEVVTESVIYHHGDTELEGYLAYPVDSDAEERKHPAVLVFHEWKGLNDYAKGRARQLAELGYVAFAVDMYGRGIYARDHVEAGQLAGALKGDRALMRERARAAYDVLRNNPHVLGDKIAAIGYCFGGTAVLEMARAGMDLVAVVSFHGGLETPSPAAPGVIKAKVLVLQGAEDPFVKHDEVEALKDEMRKAGADFKVELFEGAVHSFTVPEAGNDPSKGAAYSADADKRSWQMMKDLFQQVLS